MGRVVRTCLKTLSTANLIFLFFRSSILFSLPPPRLMHFYSRSAYILTYALLSFSTLFIPLTLASHLPLLSYSTCSVIRTGSLKLVHDTSESAPKFEYRAESNFFASMEMSEYCKMERSDDADQDRNREQDRNLYSSGKFETISLSLTVSSLLLFTVPLFTRTSISHHSILFQITQNRNEDIHQNIPTPPTPSVCVCSHQLYAKA